ncbi:nuclear transport factor 2 family protein [uncultured Amnibacterium sp.]|uniref:nuclear transport factor 2 family protein n=1 Tax=uncultured Amnibacterium sp. TaxID=1631851 RepID=UPI0035C9DA38
MPATNPPTDPAAALQWLVDREAIRNLIVDFAMRLDDQDTDAYLENFVEDAIVVLPHGRVSGRAALAGMPKPPPDWTAQHLFGAIAIELDGDRATTRAYLAATHVFGEITENAHAGGWYEHVVVRTPDGWRFKELTLTILWETKRPMIPKDMPGAS